MQGYLKVYHSARIFPTATQFMGSYTVLLDLLKSTHNNMLRGGSLMGGSSRRYVLDDGLQTLQARDDDGQLTALEHSALRIPEEIAWQGTVAQLRELQ